MAYNLNYRNTFRDFYGAYFEKKELRTRNIIQFLNVTLQKAEGLTESGKLALTGTDFANKILGDKNFK